MIANNFDFCQPEHRCGVSFSRHNRHVCTFSIDSLPWSGLKTHPKGSARGFSSQFGFGRTNSQLQENCWLKLAHSAWGEATTPPILGPTYISGPSQEPGCKQKPKGSCHQLHPDLYSRLCPWPVKLSGHKPQFPLFKPQAMLYRKTLWIESLSLRQTWSSTCSHIDQSQGTFVTLCTVGTIFSDTVQTERLLRPLPHAHIRPATNFKRSPIPRADSLCGIWLRLCAGVRKLDLLAPDSRSASTRIG